MVKEASSNWWARHTPSDSKEGESELSAKQYCHKIVDCLINSWTIMGGTLSKEAQVGLRSDWQGLGLDHRGYTKVVKWVLNVPLSIALENPWPPCPTALNTEDYYRLSPFPVSPTLTQAVAIAGLKRAMPALPPADARAAIEQHQATTCGPRAAPPSDRHLSLLGRFIDELFKPEQKRRWNIRGEAAGSSTTVGHYTHIPVSERGHLGASSTIGGARGKLKCFCGDSEQVMVGTGWVWKCRGAALGSECRGEVKTAVKVGEGELGIKVPLGPHVRDDYLWSSLWQAEEEKAKVCAVPDALKVRIITAGSPHLNFLRPIQRRMWTRLKSHPVFQFTAGMPYPEALTSIFERASLPGYIVNSADYSAATDQIPTETSVFAIRRILRHFQQPQDVDNSEWERVVTVAENSLAHNTLIYPAEAPGGKPVSMKQTRGQMMGNLLSFPILCLVNFTIWAESVLVDGDYSLEHLCLALRNNDDLPVRINGDDLLSAQRENSSFPGIVAKAGWALSVGKSYLHKTTGCINSMFFQRAAVPSGVVQVGVEVDGSGLKWGGMNEGASDEEESFASWLSRLSAGQIIGHLRNHWNLRGLLRRLPGHPFLLRSQGGRELLRYVSEEVYQDVLADDVLRRMLRRRQKQFYLYSLFARSPEVRHHSAAQFRREKELRSDFEKQVSGINNCTLSRGGVGSVGQSCFGMTSPPEGMVDATDGWFQYLGIWRESRLKHIEYSLPDSAWVRDQFFIWLRRNSSVAPPLSKVRRWYREAIRTKHEKSTPYKVFVPAPPQSSSKARRSHSLLTPTPRPPLSASFCVGLGEGDSPSPRGSEWWTGLPWYENDEGQVFTCKTDLWTRPSDSSIRKPPLTDPGKPRSQLWKHSGTPRRYCQLNDFGVGPQMTDDDIYDLAWTCAPVVAVNTQFRPPRDFSPRSPPCLLPPSHSGPCFRLSVPPGSDVAL